MGGPGLCKPGPLPFRKAPEPSKHGKDEYLPVADEELDSLALESTHTIDIEKFVPSSEIDERYRDSRTMSGRMLFRHLGSNDPQEYGGLGKAVISRRKRIVMLEPFDKGLMATTLRYGYEVRDAKAYFEDVPPAP